MKNKKLFEDSTWNFVGPYWSFFWIKMQTPFAKVVVFEDKLRLKIPFKAYDIPFKDIDAVNITQTIKSKGLYYHNIRKPFFKIIHHNKKYASLEFYFLTTNQQKYLKLFKKLGVKLK